MATSISLLCSVTISALILLGSLVQGIPTTPNYRTGRPNIAPRAITLGLKRNPNYRPNGPAEYARALRKWGAKVPGALVDSLAVMRDSVGEVGATSVHNDREYLSRVGFGTPLQFLDVDLDTGSSDVWVYSSETRKSVAGDRPVWKMEKSSTAKKVANATWSIAYGDGSHAWGNIYTDAVSLGGIAVPNATLESAVSASSSLTSDLAVAGIFGLAYSLPSQTTPQQSSVLSLLLPHLPSPLFTADLRYHSPTTTGNSEEGGDDDDGGAYTFGTIPPSRHTSPILYTPLVANASFWQIPYTGIHIGQQREWYLSGRFSAIVDTGTSLLLLSRAAVELYYAAVPGASRNESVFGGVWTFPCDLGEVVATGRGQQQNVKGGQWAEGGKGGKWGWDDGGKEGELPDFEIGFASGFVGRVPGRYLNYTVMPDDAGRCMGGLQEWEYDDFGILGDVFLKAVYAVFDVGGGRVGFAQKALRGE